MLGCLIKERISCKSWFFVKNLYGDVCYDVQAAGFKTVFLAKTFYISIGLSERHVVP